MVTVNVRYFSHLVGPPYEINPRLFFWSSTSRHPDHTKLVPIKFEQDSPLCDGGQFSSLLDVTIPLNLATFRRDDRIWVETFVDSPTQEGMNAGARAGCTDFLLKDLYDAVYSGELTFKKNLILKQLAEEDGDNSKKGEIELSIPSSSLAKIRQWKFKELGVYDYVDQNADFIDELIGSNILTALSPYGDNPSGVRFKAAVKHLESIHLPVWVSNVFTPAWVYWHLYSDLTVSEVFASNLSQISLDRHGLTRDKFIKTADLQFARTDATYNEEFNDVVVASVDTSYILATSLFYKSDETYVREEYGFLGNKLKITKIGLESLNDPLRMKGDDCEGLGVLNHRTTMLLKTGLKEHRGKNPWNKNGGWKDPVLQRIQRVLFWYISGGSLGSVTAARIGGEKTLNAPLLIDSYEDKHSELGAHMWQESIPVPLFEEMINQINSNKLQVRSVRHPPWAAKLPYCVGEGTGAVYPLLQPLSNYHPKRRELKEAHHVNQLKGMDFVLKNAKFFRFGQIQRFPKHAENVENARLSNFYRRSTTFSTNELFNEGFPFSEFVWTQTEPRVHPPSKRIINFGDDGNGWKWGVNMRDKIYATTEDTRSVGLIPVPSANEEQMLAIKSVVRHLPPLKFPNLTRQTKSELESWALPSIRDFQDKVNSITEGRNLDGSEVKINVIMRDSLFFKASLKKKDKTTIKLKDGLLLDVGKIKEIRHVHAVFEPITNNIFNVRLEVYLNLSTPLVESSLITGSFPELELCKTFFGNDSPQQFAKDFVLNGTIIGEGGAGRVYINDKFPGIVIKTTRRVSVCRGFNTEFQTAKALQSSLTMRLENVRMINPIAKIDLDDNILGFDCALVLERVFRPPNLKFNNKSLALQAYLGSSDTPDLVLVTKSRGIYLGPNVIEKILGPLEPVVTDMAAFLADMQYNAGYDGLDMEYIIGYTMADPKLKIYVIDFDQVTQVKDYSDYRQLEWPISAEPYFPTEGKLFGPFRNKYVEVAARAGYREIAQKVVDQL